MKLLKHITAALLLAILMLPMATPIVLQLKQLYVQWEMLEALEEKELITITVNVDEVQWVHKGKECLINGQMFDVKSSHYNKEQVLLTGLFDEKEKEIKASIAKQTKEQQENSRSAKWIKLFQFNAVTTGTNGDISIFAFNNATLFNKYKPLFYSSPFSGVAAPPPKYS